MHLCKNMWIQFFFIYLMSLALVIPLFCVNFDLCHENVIEFRLRYDDAWDQILIRLCHVYGLLVKYIASPPMDTLILTSFFTRLLKLLHCQIISSSLLIQLPWLKIPILGSFICPFPWNHDLLLIAAESSRGDTTELRVGSTFSVNLYVSKFRIFGFDRGLPQFFQSIAHFECVLCVVVGVHEMTFGSGVNIWWDCELLGVPNSHWTPNDVESHLSVATKNWTKRRILEKGWRFIQAC